MTGRWWKIVLLLVLTRGVAAAGPDYFGTTVTRDEFRASLLQAGIPAGRLPLLGASHYVLVRRSEVSALVSLARHRLSRDLGPRWDSRFNCLSFAWNLVNEASKQLAREQWHAPLPEAGAAIRPAIVTVAYIENGGDNGHAVNLVVTDEGPVWCDPQSGLVELPPHALATVYYPNT